MHKAFPMREFWPRQKLHQFVLGSAIDPVAQESSHLKSHSLVSLSTKFQLDELIEHFRLVGVADESLVVAKKEFGGEGAQRRGQSFEVGDLKNNAHIEPPLAHLPDCAVAAHWPHPRSCRVC